MSVIVQKVNDLAVVCSVDCDLIKKKTIERSFCGQSVMHNNFLMKKCQFCDLIFY